MPRLSKLLLNNTVVFVTTSTEEGLPFPPNPLINTLLESSLTRAQHLHPVTICHHAFESNHAHFIMVVENPDDIKDFMARFKTESSHAVNRLLGRRKKTIWCEGYDSPVLLTREDVIEKIVYLYTNPTRDNLVDSLSSFPGLCSWEAFQSKKHSKVCPWIRRPAVPELEDEFYSVSQFQRIARKLRKEATLEHTFQLSPDAWMKCFGITDSERQKAINQIITERVKSKEQAYREHRAREGKSVVGKEKLMLQPVDTPYTPKREGRKMWCICADIELRKAFIRGARALVKAGREVYRRWKLGDFSVPYPPGLFPPGMPKIVERRRASLALY